MRRAARGPTTIHTAASLQRTNRKLARRSVGVRQVLSAMEKGAALLMFYEHGRAIWKLSTGIFIPAEIADVIIHNANVAGVGDCLFGHAGTSQTFRWINNQGGRTS